MANRPDQITTVTTTNVGQNVEIAWLPTPDARNSPVYEYRIKIQRKDGTYVLHP
jgi:hypothetical protein